jgi:cyclopropane fatty-acyl-phospholipid synthase-like methyltransferase
LSTESSRDTDRSNGWEAVADVFVDSSVGVATIQAWTRYLPAGGAVLDLGCGPGGLRSEALVRAGLAVYAVDAAPSLARAYQRRFPSAQVVCEAAEDSAFFGRQFDGVLSWGLLFLLSPDTQRATIHRVAAVLKPGARFLFTAPLQVCEWLDNSTGRLSQSLGRDSYRAVLADARLTLAAEYEDEGENHYYDAVKR